MTATLPADLAYGQVKWTAVSPAADTGIDPDALPDPVAVTGTVTFTPSAKVLLATAGNPVTVIGRDLTYDLGADGVLRDAQGHDTITLVATDSPGVTPTGWTWTVSYRLNDGLTRGSFAFALPAGSTVDLTTAAPVTASGGTPITQGPPGPPGSPWPLVIHGTNAATARPDVDTPVIWFGSVPPDNGDPDLDVYIPVTSFGG